MKVIIFGVGNYFQIQRPKLNSLSDIEIIAFADNNPALWGKLFGEVPVIPPAEIPAAAFDKVIIVSLYVSEIFKQLIDLGVDRDKIVSWPHFWSERMKGRIKIFSPESKREKREKKVLIISNDLNYDGASLAAIYAAIALNKCWSVVLAVPLGNNKLIKETVDAGITVAICPALPWMGMEEKNWAKQFDAVIVNTFPMIESVLEVREILPVVWWLHEPVGNYSIVMMQYPDGIKEKEFRDITLCAVSRKALQNFNRIWPERFGSILPLGIPDRLKTENMTDRTGSVVFAIIGGVGAMKGQEVFLDAAERISMDEKAEFWIIGRMDENAYCQKIREKAETVRFVRILGELTRTEMEDVLPKIDVVVCASQEETLSIAVIEGMMSGKPCITTSNTGIADYIEDGNNGFVVDYGDAGALAERMNRLIKDKNRLKDMGTAARETYEKYFNMEVFKCRLEDMIYEAEKV